MIINRDEHPHAKFVRDDEGAVHIVDAMGDPWCDIKDEEPELFEEVTPIQDGEVTREDMCEACFDAGVDEDFLTP